MANLIMAETPRPVRSCCSVAGVLLLCAVAFAQGRNALTEARNRMVDEEIVGGGVKNPRVIESMRATPRHEFVSLSQRRDAYYDMALPIGESQTISPPLVVALMTEALDPQPTDKVLEIGTGSGYQAAVLSALVAEVYTIEIVEPLGRRAEKTLKRLGYKNVSVKVGDGYQGWPEHAPFDKIIVTCSPEDVPPALVAQLKEGGRMVIPVGERYQQTMVLLKKTKGKLLSEALRPTLFVPMTGAAEAARKVLPDPARPALVNGNFEEVLDDRPVPAGWYYSSQMELVEDGTAAEGKRCVTFRNTTPGRAAKALQGFAVDGRVVRALDVALRVRAKNLRQGQTPQQVPLFGIVFYDEDRKIVGQGMIGPWRDTFPWQPESKRIDVPPKAREAIVRMGLMGATGEISFDDIRLGAAR